MSVWCTDTYSTSMSHSIFTAPKCPILQQAWAPKLHTPCHDDCLSQIHRPVQTCAIYIDNLPSKWDSVVDGGNVPLIFTNIPCTSWWGWHSFFTFSHHTRIWWNTYPVMPGDLALINNILSVVRGQPRSIQASRLASLPEAPKIQKLPASTSSVIIDARVSVSLSDSLLLLVLHSPVLMSLWSSELTSAFESNVMLGYSGRPACLLEPYLMYRWAAPWRSGFRF